MYHYEGRLDPRAAERLAPHERHDEHVATVLARLRAAGAPEEVARLRADGDGAIETVALQDGARELLWAGAGFLSCVPGRLGLYVGEDGSTVMLLTRPA